MTQILTPFKDAIRNRNEEGRYFVRDGKNTRMCWTCQEQKLIKGGAFPGQQKGQQQGQRFRCADCTERLIARKAAIAA